MTTFINLHILQPFAYANPNRDDTGSPKSAFYGGVLRGRISSQSWKRAIRLRVEDVLDQRSFRSSPKGLAPILAERVTAVDPSLSSETAYLASWLAVAAFTTKSAQLKTAKKDLAEHLGGEAADRSDDDSDSALAWFTSRELDLIASTLATGGALAEADDKSIASVVQAQLKPLLAEGFGPAAPMVAAFGRMYANAQGLGVDAAVQVSHAITVSEMTQEIDYFTAVDDCDPHGAGHLGLNQFTGGIFYRNLSIDVTSYLDASNATDPATLKVLVESMIEALPSGKKSTTANNERPIAVVAEVGPRALSYEGAFERPLPADAGAATAVETLLSHIDRCESMALGDTPRRWVATSAEVDAEAVPLRELVDEVLAAAVR